MKNIKKLKNSRGFTLTEIVVVMVLLGLIITIATSITLIINHSQEITQLDSKDEGELIKLRTAFDDWLMLYDSDMCTVEVNDCEIIIRSAEDETVSMWFEDGKLNYTENIGYEPQASQVTIQFTSINDITFAACDGNIIKCTIHFSKTDYKIINHLRAAQILRS